MRWRRVCTESGCWNRRFECFRIGGSCWVDVEHGSKGCGVGVDDKRGSGELFVVTVSGSCVVLRYRCMWQDGVDAAVPSPLPESQIAVLRSQSAQFFLRRLRPVIRNTLGCDSLVRAAAPKQLLRYPQQGLTFTMSSQTGTANPLVTEDSFQVLQDEFDGFSPECDSRRGLLRYRAVFQRSHFAINSSLCSREYFSKT